LTLPERANNFDQLRLLGALLVIYGHSYVLLGREVPIFASSTVSTFGVKIFFCISGYLVTMSWLRDPHLVRFFVRRSLRIFPALIAIVLLTTFVMGPLLTRVPARDYLASSDTYNYLNNIRLHITYFLPGVFETNIHTQVVNGSLWSLPVEFAMYLAVPALVGLAALVRRRWAFAAMVGAFVAATLWVTKVQPQKQWIVYETNIWTILELGSYFVLSAACAVYQLEHKLNPYVAMAGLLALALFQPGPVVQESLLMFVLPYVTLCYGTGDAPLARVLRSRDLSYGLFLYGFPVQQILIQFFGTYLSPWRLFATATLIAAGFAWVSWHFIEVRALAHKPKPARTSAPRFITST
jgi:peptidoglycan/LPS O-acetylase OafA/YrhL